MTVSLDDKYLATDGHVYLTGSQALVRLPIMQRQLDRIAGLNTAGFISGYRGSPLGIYDLALWQAREHLERNEIIFQPGINEDLAATAVWGTQQTGLVGKSKYDGVFAMWYGKGPGVDRSGDPLKHGSYAGASTHGGVLALCGDDHAARSSTIAHQSDHALIHFGMPVFNPAHIQDFLDLGLAGLAMSRYSGAWVGFKCITDTVETSARVDITPSRHQFVTPDDFEMPIGGLNLRLGITPLAAEQRQYDLRMEAVKAFVRANRLDQIILGEPSPRALGIVTSGKTTLDVLEALRALGIDDAKAKLLGIGVYKLAVTWPIEPESLRRFVAGSPEILIVEEKRAIIEEQLAHLLFNLPADQRPILTGKRDVSGAPLLSQVGELSPASVRSAILARLMAASVIPNYIKQEWRAPDRDAAAAAVTASAAGLVRAPSFCAGCPHNTSTHVPEGSIAVGGIGCHGLATWLPERRTVTLYHMGGEGAAWIGQAPFSEEDHIFQNLGDGTYFHSGLLAIRACVTSGVNITFKILLNGAIAMTGGQPIEGEVFDGGVTAPNVAAQLAAEGVARIAVVADDPSRHDAASFPAGVTFHHRDNLEDVQKSMRGIKGVTAIIYDQSCATERRRLRKRGKIADPDRRFFIMPEVCEGCGDCGIQSNCVAIEPLETEIGRKRKINQSVCNKDFSCEKGMCPSFITVKGGTPRKINRKAVGHISAIPKIPEPSLPSLDRLYSLLIAGIGGNGVVTIGAIIGMAAHIEGINVSVLDISGLAQRNGPVTSHVRFTAKAVQEHVSRIPEDAADVVIGCDLVVTASPENLAKLAPGKTQVIYNQFVAPTAAFATNPKLDLGYKPLLEVLEKRLSPDCLHGFDASTHANEQLGDSIGANMMLVGYAWQKGLIPLTRGSIEEAIRLNGVAVELNLNAFQIGREAAHNPRSIQRSQQSLTGSDPSHTLDDMVNKRAALLTEFDGPERAKLYIEQVDAVRVREIEVTGQVGLLTEAVAKAYFKALYYKDEYEVARLLTNGVLKERLRENFEGDLKISFNLAPPSFSKKDSKGREKKREFGAWILPLLHILARMKLLRETPLDIFGWSKHRKIERELGAKYAQLLSELLPVLTASNLKDIAEIAGRYEGVKGFSIVKEKNLAEVERHVSEALSKLKTV